MVNCNFPVVLIDDNVELLFILFVFFALMREIGERPYVSGHSYPTIGDCTFGHDHSLIMLFIGSIDDF